MNRREPIHVNAVVVTLATLRSAAASERDLEGQVTMRSGTSGRPLNGQFFDCFFEAGGKVMPVATPGLFPLGSAFAQSSRLSERSHV